VLHSRKIVGRLVSLAAEATVADIMIEVTRHHKFSTVGWYIRVYVARIRHHFQGSLISFRLGHYFMIRFILQQRNIVDQQNHHSVHILFYLDLMIWSIACSFYLLLFFMWLGVILSNNTLWVKTMCPCIIPWFYLTPSNTGENSVFCLLLQSNCLIKWNTKVDFCSYLNYRKSIYKTLRNQDIIFLYYSFNISFIHVFLLYLVMFFFTGHILLIFLCFDKLIFEKKVYRRRNWSRFIGTKIQIEIIWNSVMIWLIFL